MYVNLNIEKVKSYQDGLHLHQFFSCLVRLAGTDIMANFIVFFFLAFSLLSH
jgi:hypothetical protein